MSGVDKRIKSTEEVFLEKDEQLVSQMWELKRKYEELYAKKSLLAEAKNPKLKTKEELLKSKQEGILSSIDALDLERIEGEEHATTIKNTMVRQAEEKKQKALEDAEAEYKATLKKIEAVYEKTTTFAQSQWEQMMKTVDRKITAKEKQLGIKKQSTDAQLTVLTAKSGPECTIENEQMKLKDKMLEMAKVIEMSRWQYPGRDKPKWSDIPQLPEEEYAQYKRPAKETRFIDLNDRSELDKLREQAKREDERLKKEAGVSRDELEAKAKYEREKAEEKRIAELKERRKREEEREAQYESEEEEEEEEKEQVPPPRRQFAPQFDVDRPRVIQNTKKQPKRVAAY